MSKQRTHKFATKILRKTCSSLVKIISDRENNLTRNKYNKLQKRSAFFAENKCKSAYMGKMRTNIKTSHEYVLMNTDIYGYAHPSTSFKNLR